MSRTGDRPIRMTTIRRIFVPFDYSAAAEAALLLATETAVARNAELLVSHFVEIEVHMLGRFSETRVRAAMTLHPVTGAPRGERDDASFADEALAFTLDGTRPAALRERRTSTAVLPRESER